MKKEQIYPYINEIAMRLKNPGNFGGVSLMIGAGFSKNAICKGALGTQPPNWSELAEKMYCELYPLSDEHDEKQKEKWIQQRIIMTSGKNVTKLAEEYIANFDRNKINQLIEESIADALFVPGEMHRRLLRLNWQDIFTTNYDTLLERTAELIYRDRNYKIVYSLDNLPGSIRPRIVKLHGSIPQVKPYIICDEDYRTYPVKFAAMVNTVQQAMLETRLCLIGFSGEDPNFQNWLGWLRDNMGEYCPKIYLIGVYDDLKEPQRKILESKQVTVIDISGLADKKEKNKHYSALLEFLVLLEKQQKGQDIYSSRPYPEIGSLDIPEDKEKYISDMAEYSAKVVSQIQPYILLPEDIRKKFDDYFTIHFQIVLSIYKKKYPLQLISNIIKILRKCLVILEDMSAEKLENICTEFCDINVISDTDLEGLIEINLYLLEMYRIDSREEDYKKKIRLLEKIIERVPWHRKELCLEKIKKLIEEFKYDEAKHLTDEFEANTWEDKIKKAGIYKQLSEYELADQILSECSSELAQMRLPEDIYLSYIGYLNLCHRAERWRILPEYSDSDYYKKYNTRYIIINLKADLSEEFFRKDNEAEEVMPFSLNSEKKVTYIVRGEDKLCKKCFNFMLALDRLYLPLFRDQIDILPRVIEKTIKSSQYTYWKLSLGVRCDNENVLDRIFTREILSGISSDEIKLLYSALTALISKYKPNDSYERKKYILSIKSILNISSRLIIYLEDDAVAEYLKLICRFSQEKDVFLKRDIEKIIRRISTRFNSKIARMCEDIIFMDFGTQYHLCSYFNEILFDIDENKVDEYYRNAISLANNTDLEKRDCGIAQLMTLWENSKNSNYRALIENTLWKDSDGLFPRSSLYYPFVWEELPHPAEINFAERYYQYLFEDRYVESATNFGSVSNDSAHSVFVYLNFFYCTSNISKRECKKVVLEEKLAAFMLDTAYKFILHEESLLKRKNDFWEEVDGTREKYIRIGELAALIYIEATREGFIEKIRAKVKEIKNTLEKYKIPVLVINMVEAIERGLYDQCMELFEDVILSENKEAYSNVFLGMKCLLFHLENDPNGSAHIADTFKNCLHMIRYLNVDSAKIIWQELGSLLRHKLFIDETIQIEVALLIERCINAYTTPVQEGKRNYLDSLYNCTNALYVYYNQIQRYNVPVVNELEACVQKVRNVNNREIKAIWERSGEIRKEAS